MVSDRENELSNPGKIGGGGGISRCDTEDPIGE